MSILCLDVGSKKIGVAKSDTLCITAQPLMTIKRHPSKVEFKEITKLIERYNIKKIVVGLPRNMDGTTGSQANTVLSFIESLKTKTNITIVTWDERLSTACVTKLLIYADISRKKRRRVIDKLAAAFILQGYLDSVSLKNAEA